MLEVRLLCIGKLKESYWRDAVAEYEKRLKPLCKFQLIELPEARLPNAPSPAQISAALAEEGKSILEKAAGTVFPLCIEGKETDSPGLAKRLEQAMQFPGAVTFVIGSSHGLAEQVKEAGERLSMSPMTFPHQLARVMLCEQLYRAFQILNGTKYHK
ncbi:23S rRNA (pseudouridine(1915)-N(3))-methyltransferase RlmH [Neglectibacter caecimuris]|uniref:23S rRNA (pseudouridine(1915)-N(3))-methyltransferase RlmH n=1 Tax=Neglectibacter caecimuris TaxID=3093658 RepID=UPI002AC90AE8|nr:23S rRNA (pseudouridine(1915)-N(3))-methyltransferase RlmH [Neglectibacter sp. M00184]